jgi:glycine/D-amino acid oxidase-like deaminating enzyme
MSQKPHTLNQRSGKSDAPDLIVIGAGIFGLWAARHAIRRGERVLVLEKRSIGEGASGGFLGALMPHMPDNWNAKKQMQFEALVSIGEAIGELESDTGLSCGFRRCGRLMPLTHEGMLDHAAQRVDGANKNWVNGRQRFGMELLRPGFAGTVGENWLSQAVAPFGATYDNLSARVNPRAYVNALAAFVRQNEKGEIIEGADVASVSAGRHGVVVKLQDGKKHMAGRVVIANGWEAYGLLRRMRASASQVPVTGRGVKGQAVLLDHVHEDNRPILYDSGSYVVPHAGKRIAIGSTSQDRWKPHILGDEDEAWSTESYAGELVPDDPWTELAVNAAARQFDPDNMDFYDHGLALCPSLKSAPIIERWANVRPRNTMADPATGKVGTEPLFGAIDGDERISVAIGGFKISLGLAHLVK